MLGGIIRKPEIKPLSVFNKERGGGSASSAETSLEIEVDVNMEEREDSNDDQWPSENENEISGEYQTSIDDLLACGEHT